jgi:hypothetical protein
MFLEGLLLVQQGLETVSLWDDNYLDQPLALKFPMLHHMLGSSHYH